MFKDKGGKVLDGFGGLECASKGEQLESSSCVVVFGTKKHRELSEDVVITMTSTLSPKPRTLSRAPPT